MLPAELQILILEKAQVQMFVSWYGRNSEVDLLKNVQSITDEAELVINWVVGYVIVAFV